MEYYLEKIQKALKDKTGVKDVESLEYRDLPEGSKEFYNTSLTIGNINLTAGRFKTEKEADELVNKFLNIPLP